MDNKLVRQISAALRVSTPLIGIETPDQSATISLLIKNVNGDRPYLRFDLSGGLAGLNELGKAEVEELAKEAGVPDPGQLINASETLALALRLQPKSVLFVLNSPYLFDNPVAVQAISNLRDQFKSNKRCLVLLGGMIKLPAELQNDVVLFEEEYPTAAELQEILLSVYRPSAEKYGWGELDGKTLENAIDALRGLPAFLAEQITAMSLDKERGLDLDSLWQRKIKAIEQTPGLSVDRGVGELVNPVGQEEVEALADGIFAGKHPPKCILRLDEVDKLFAGMGAKGGAGDSSGVSQDMAGVFLRAMEDYRWQGLLAKGSPGTGKTLLSKAIGRKYGILSIGADTGAMRGSLVGQSEAMARSFIKQVLAIAGEGGALFVATCNKVDTLPPEVIARFTLGLWEFDKPDKQAREGIWLSHLEKYDLNYVLGDLPDDEGWVGRDIRNCCELAWRMGVSPKVASRFVGIGGKPLKASRSTNAAPQRQVDLG